jgi:hypothetical protein
MALEYARRGERLLLTARREAQLSLLADEYGLVLLLSCLVLSCLVWSCLVLSCLVLSCRVLSCLVLSCLVSLCLHMFVFVLVLGAED